MSRAIFRVDSDSKPTIVVYVFGEVGNGKVDRIVGIMRQCYDRMAPHDVEMVDLYVFERSSALEAFLIEESSKVGVASSSFDALFFSMHDAWQGIPRIIVCLERMKEIPALAQEGGIRHEVGHSVLHGSLDYYIFPVPPALQGLGRRLRMSRQNVTNVLYLISIAVKDFEVSRLLRKHGYVNDQIAFAERMLILEESDEMAWRLSKAKPEAEILCLTSYLKLIAYATPFLTRRVSKGGVDQHLRASLSLLPKKLSSKLLEDTPEIFQQLGSDTTENINKFTRLFVEEIVEPILKDVMKFLP